MYKPAVAVVAAILLPVAAHAETKVLFIGNSFTIGGTKSVPATFDALANAGGHGDPTTVMQAVGGTDFQYHFETAASRNVIDSQDWDYVILQNYSIEPTHFKDGTHSVADHLFYGTALYNAIIENNPLTRVVLYETWSRAVGHSYITGTSGPTTFATTAEMQRELRVNYAGLADLINSGHPSNAPVVVAPVGSAWENAGGLRSPGDPLFVDLFGSDLYHGDDDGYYLSAATIYSTIFGVSPEGLSTHSAVSGLGLSRNVSAAHLESVAWTTVQSVPEPGAAVASAVGGVLLLGGRRRLVSAGE